MVTMAREQIDGTWVLNGSKMWITNGSQAQAAIVWAKTNGDKSDKSIRGFIVPTNAKGFTAKDQKGKLSLRASDTSELVFQDVCVGADSILPKSGGLKSPLMCLTQARYGISWGAIGAAMACYEEALSYSRNRVIFDKPLAAFQLQQARLADMVSEIVKAQLVSLHLGRLKDLGTMTPQQVSLMAQQRQHGDEHRARSATAPRRERHSGRVCVDAPQPSLKCTRTRAHDVHTLILGQAVTGINAFN